MTTTKKERTEEEIMKEINETVYKSYRSNAEYTLAPHNKKGEKEYEAFCIEDGERFVCNFFSCVTDKKLLYEIGQDQASGFGGQCTSVKVKLSEQEAWNKACTKVGLEPKDFNRKFKLKENTYTLKKITRAGSLEVTKDGDNIHYYKYDKKYIPNIKKILI